MRIHFVFLLVIVLAAAAVHAALSRPRSRARAAGLFLVYLLAGYCGLPMLCISLWAILRPESVAAAFGFPAGPLIGFFGWAYLGMSLSALLALRFRGIYLLAPVVVWSVYLGGATFVHMGAAGPMAGGHAQAAFLDIFAAHGLIGLLLVVAFALSEEWRAQPSRAPERCAPGAPRG
jgi:hypothetical protein